MAVQGVSPKRQESKLKFRGAPFEWHHLSETPITSHSEPACTLARNDTVSEVPYTINSNLQKQTINSEKTLRPPKEKEKPVHFRKPKMSGKSQGTPTDSRKAYHMSLAEMR